MSASNEVVLNSSKKAGAFLLPYFMYERDEVVYLVCQDVQGRVLSCDKISEGVVNATDVRLRKIMERVVETRADGIIIAHNHPNGVALPSDADAVTTRQIKQMLKSIGVRLRDHIVVAGDDFVSMADSGMLSW